MPTSPTPDELKARYPYMFSGGPSRLEPYKGWVAIFARSCDEIDALLEAVKRGFHWVEIKEKLGFARFRYRIDRQGCGAPNCSNDHAAARSLGHEISDDTVLEAITEARRRAEDATAYACIVCGASAERVGLARALCALDRPSRPIHDTANAR